MATWNPRANNLFLQALEICDHSARAVFVEEACRGDPDVWEQVLSLLDASDLTDNLLDHPVIVTDATGRFVSAGEGESTCITADESVGTQIGPYKLIEQIGEGGMGAVYLARQTEPVKRMVALKVIKAGMDSRQILARFEAERQALALMDHPNIARVLDAGVLGPAAGPAANGEAAEPRRQSRPYFVMELVKGTPITRFCDERKLTPRERLELFLQVCQAIQHAHQKGIIHRDIKPTNVLVSPNDGKPTAKVIDFGIAKAAGQPLTERTLLTGFGAVIGTPEYMSPEQAELNQLDIDIRSDVYSLGILLYELLTGTTPLTRKRIKETSLFEVLRVIREEEPEKPSTRLSTAEELASIAAKRGTEPARLSRQLRGEIDWIVMKALEKDRARRYETANGLAADVRRYLAGEEVHAVPPSVGYRLKKFARRNKRALASAGLLGGMLLVLVAGFGWVVSDRAARQAQIAFEVNRFLQQAESFHANNKLPEAVAEVEKARGVLGTGGGEELHRRVEQWHIDLDTAAKLEEIRMEFTQREARDRVYAEYARAFREYGIDVEALPADEAAARIAASNIKLDLVLALDRWASSLQFDPQPRDPAQARLLRAIAQAADPDPWRLRYNAASESKNLPALREITAGLDPTRVRPRTLATLGYALKEAGDTEAAVAFLRKVQRQYPSDFSINYFLSYCLRYLNPTPWEEVIAYRRVAVALRPQSYTAQNALGYALQVQGRLDEAGACYKKAIEIDGRHGMAHYNLGLILRELGELEEAIACFKKASDLLPTDPYPQYYLAWQLITCPEHRLRDPARALALARKAVELAPPPGADWVGNYWMALGAAQYRNEHLEDALAALRTAEELKKGDCRIWFFMAMVQSRLDKRVEARDSYDRAVARMREKQLKDGELIRLRAEAAQILGIAVEDGIEIAPPPRAKS